MYEKHYLTPIDQEMLDPYGRNRNSINVLKNSPLHTNPKTSICNQSGQFYLEKLIDINKSLLKQSDAHKDYIQWNIDYQAKYGPQGGHFEFSVIEDYYKRSYANADMPKSFNLALQGAKWLSRYICQLIDKGFVPQDVATSIVSTNAALPTGFKKGTFIAETQGKSLYDFIHIYPNLPGERFMRMKKRTINQDSIVNVRHIESLLNKVREYLKYRIPECFGAWLNPADAVQPIATKIVDRNMWCVETDYEKMDEHFSYDAVVNCVLPIYEAVLTPDEYYVLAQYVDEMFDQPIYFGNYMYTGRHNLLSGQPPTNDFETIMQVCQAIGVLLEMDLDPLAVLQLHLGDDQAIAFRTQKQAITFYNMYVAESNQNGLLINEEKSVIRHGQCQFCRKLYYPRGKRFLRNGDSLLIGAYPTVLCLNSIVNPERMSETKGMEALATYQRLDNCIGSPDYQYLLNIISAYTDLMSTDFTDDEITKVNARDWWIRVYGEVWSPLASPSFKRLHRIE